MSKATKLLALSFLIAPTFLAATVQAEALTTHEEQLNSQPTNVMKPDALNDAAVKKPKTTVTSNKSLNDAVEYTANETEYAAGDQYEGSLHIVNQDGTPISAGSRIIISIPKEAVDYDSWDFSDPNISPLFTVTTSKENSTLTFSFKSDITGKADINIMFSGKVIGAEDNAYPVSAMAQNADGTSAGVTVYNDEIIIPKKVDPTPIYGLLNMFWGVEQSQKQTSSFIGKRPIDLNNIPTGVFSRKTNAVQNFVEINPKNKTSLTNDMHYELAYEINSTKNYGKVAINDFEVLDAQRGGALVPSSAYSVTKEGANKLNFIFKSPAEGGTYGDGTPIINPNSKYIINVTSSATDDGDVYKADSVLQRKEAHSTTPVSEQEFPLNIMFTREGSSNVFPNLKVADKVFNVGELTQENILAKLNKGVTATDPIDGDLTSKIVTNYSDLLKFKDTPGIYQQKVRYSVTNLKGNSSTQPITVAIIDKAKAADLTVSYQDTEGNKIADDIIKSGELGSPYTTEQKVIEGYTFKEVKGNVNGKLTADPQTVTYIYTKDPVQAANVTVNYQDSAGNTIAPNVVKNGNVGDPYTTEQKTIPGYTFKEVEGNVNGKLTADPQTVTYIYTKDPVQAANVTVNYQDSTGNTVAATEVKSGNVGDPYTTEQKTIPGYTFKEVKGNVNGKLTADPQTVTYIYTKDPVQAANVTVNYQDSAGNTVAATEVKSGNVGDPYTTEQKTIPGYTFKEVKGNANGKLTADPQTVTYIYAKDPVQAANVTANYQDSAGNTVAATEVKSGNVGDPYTTEQKTIPGYTFKEVKGNVNGKLTADPQTVTYIYTKDPVQTASVTASYQNTEGDPIAPNVVKNGNVGDPYTTEQKTIPGYALKEIKGDKTGIFKDKAQTITYIYTKAAVLPEPSSQTEQSTIIRYPNSSGDIVNLNHGSSIQPTSKSQALSIEKPSNSKNKSLGQINSNTPVKSNVRYPKTGESKRTSEILSLIGLGVVIAVVSFGKIILNKR